jgi:hypothetical protein
LLSLRASVNLPYSNRSAACRTSSAKSQPIEYKSPQTNCDHTLPLHLVSPWCQSLGVTPGVTLWCQLGVTVGVTIWCQLGVSLVSVGWCHLGVKTGNCHFGVTITLVSLWCHLRLVSCGCHSQGWCHVGVTGCSGTYVCLIPQCIICYTL